MGDHVMLGTSSSCAEKRFTALVVDDDPVVRKVHKMLLTKAGFEAQAVENGKEAVERFLAGENFPLVFMDMEMPVMDGPQATKILRDMGVDSMIVGITSRNLDPEKQEFMNAGLNSCYVKPMTLDKVNTIVAKIKN